MNTAREFTIERIGSQSSRNHADLGLHAYLTEEEAELRERHHAMRAERRLMIQKNAVRAKRQSAY